MHMSLVQQRTISDGRFRTVSRKLHDRHIIEENRGHDIGFQWRRTDLHCHPGKFRIADQNFVAIGVDTVRKSNHPAGESADSDSELIPSLHSRIDQPLLQLRQRECLIRVHVQIARGDTPLPKVARALQYASHGSARGEHRFQYPAADHKSLLRGNALLVDLVAAEDQVPLLVLAVGSSTTSMNSGSTRLPNLFNKLFDDCCRSASSSCKAQDDQGNNLSRFHSSLLHRPKVAYANFAICRDYVDLANKRDCVSSSEAAENGFRSGVDMMAAQANCVNVNCIREIHHGRN